MSDFSAIAACKTQHDAHYSRPEFFRLDENAPRKSFR
jgi:hypothetical protein